MIYNESKIHDSFNMIKLITHKKHSIKAIGTLLVRFIKLRLDCTHVHTLS